jgi:hypothetical protein
MDAAQKSHTPQPHRLVRCERHVDWNRHGGVCGRPAVSIADGTGLCYYHLPEFMRRQAERATH